MRKASIAGLLLAAIALGFVLENQKIAINFLLEYGEKFPAFFDLDTPEKKLWVKEWKSLRVADYFFAHNTPNWLFDLNLAQLNKVKWALALLGIAVFSAINLTIVQLAFQSVKTTRNAAVFLAFILFVCVVVYAIGFLVPSASGGFYAVARELLGGLQSPVPLMILFPAAWLQARFNSQ